MFIKLSALNNNIHHIFKPSKQKLNMETVKKNDFIEIDFTATANDQVFDTTNKEKAKEMGLEADVKPIIASVGNEMLLKGLDKELEGKEINKTYEIDLTPEQAFGKRDPKLIRIIPIKIFHQQNMNPVAGMSVQLDQHIAKILSVSGGRVTVDFNNPVAGKEVHYEFKILKKIIDNKEKINAMQEFFFKQKFEFEIKDKRVIFKDVKLIPLIKMMKEKFKQISGFDIEVKEEIASSSKEEGNKSAEKSTEVKPEEKTNSNTSKQ